MYLPSVQLAPLKPESQSQLYLLIRSWQVPPFLQGESAQSSVSRIVNTNLKCYNPYFSVFTIHLTI